MSDTLNKIAEQHDAMLTRWMEQDDLFFKSKGKEGEKMTIAQCKEIRNRLKDCDILSPHTPGDVLNKLNGNVPGLKLGGALPPLSDEDDAATA